MTEEILKSSSAWLKHLYPNGRVLDPDGWDRSGPYAFEVSWSELITEEEFERRYVQSTVQLVAKVE